MKRALYSALIFTNLSLNLGGFFIPAAFAAPEVIVTPTTGGSVISADTNTTNGTATWTPLTGPIFSEGGSGDIGIGTIILDAPDGFIFDEDLPAPTVLLSDGSNNSSRNINDLVDGSIIPVTQSDTQLTITITAATSNGVKNTLTWQNIRVRPTAGNPLTISNITNSGTSNIAGITSGSTNLGTLTEVTGNLDHITVTPDDTQNISIGSTVAFSAQGFDANNNPISGLTYTWAVVADTGTGNITSGGILTGTGSGNLTVTATNGAVTGTSGIVTVNTNNVPTVSNQSVSTDENTTLAISLSGSDINGDTLQYSITLNPSHGFLTDLNSASGTVNYIPVANYNGTDSFIFKVNDGIADSATGTISIIVNAVNSAPVLASIGNQTVNENVNLTLTISATDPENDSITYSATNTPAGATFNTNTKTFRWKPDYTQAGTYANVRFTATDGSSSTNEDITITVNNVNRAPVLSLIGDKTGAENSELTFTLTATDPDGNTLNYSGVGLPTGASVSSTTGIFSWTPNYDQSGISTTTLKVCDTDPASLCDEEAINITVSNTNRAPALDSIGVKNIAENSLLEFIVSATDPDGDAVTYSASNLPEGSAFATSTGTFSWTPTYSQAGDFPSVHFETGDGLATSTEDVTITVTNTNRAPSLNSIGDKSGKENSTLTFTISGTDPDGDAVTYSASNLPTGVTINASTGVFTWKPNFDQGGNPLSVRIEVSDGLATAGEDITITIENVSQDGGGAIIGAIGGIIGNLSFFNFGPSPEVSESTVPVPTPTPLPNPIPTPVIPVSPSADSASSPQEISGQTSSNSAGNNPISVELPGGQGQNTPSLPIATEQNPEITIPTPTAENLPAEASTERTSLLANLTDLISLRSATSLMASVSQTISQSWTSFVNFFTTFFLNR